MNKILHLLIFEYAEYQRTNEIHLLKKIKTKNLNMSIIVFIVKDHPILSICSLIVASPEIEKLPIKANKYIVLIICRALL